MIIFNLTAVGQAVLGALIAVASILGLIGLSVVGVLPSSGPTNLFVVLIPAASLTVVDLGFRLLRGPGKNDKTKNYLVDPPHSMARRPRVLRTRLDPNGGYLRCLHLRSSGRDLPRDVLGPRAQGPSRLAFSAIDARIAVSSEASSHA